MQDNLLEVTVKWKNVKVPAMWIDDKVVVVLGRWIRLARVHEEEWMEGQVVRDPETFIARLKKQKLKADVFTFLQKPPDTDPKYDYQNDWDNFAVIHIKSFEDWWERLPQESRKNTRRSAKRGVSIRMPDLDDTLIQGITDIYNEIPIRQGKPFPHYGKDFNTIKREVSTMMDRSSFIGAYYGNELIGFIKLVYLGKVASILHIVSKNAHYDKRPTNALISKAVEICSQRNISHLLYGRYIYGKKTSSPLMEFKKRNGFEKIEVPRYYVPLTLWGRVVVGLRLYRGLLGLLPSGVLNFLVNTRSRFFERASAKAGSSEKSFNVDRNHRSKIELAENSRYESGAYLEKN